MATPDNTSPILRVSGGSGDPQVFNAGFTFTAGRQAILQMGYYSDGQLFTAVSLGGTAAVRVARSVPDGSNVTTDIWFADNITGGTTSVSCDGGPANNYIAGGVTEWPAGTFTEADAGTEGKDNGSGTEASTSTDATTSQSTVVFANIILIGGGTDYTASGPSGWTVAFQETSNDYAPGRGVWKEETTTGIKTADFDITPTVDWRACIVAMKLAGGGGAATRGTPFGHRGTAFNGGRTFNGILQRALWLPQPRNRFA